MSPSPSSETDTNNKRSRKGKKASSAPTKKPSTTQAKNASPAKKSSAKQAKITFDKGKVSCKKLSAGRRNGSKPVLVVLPGSSGSLGKGVRNIFMRDLEEHFEVREREGKWKGWNPAGEANVKSVLDVAPQDGTEWYLLGNSFGNRVICAMCTENLFTIPPLGIIMCGYPMYGPNGSNERVEMLQSLSLPDTTKLLCISGEKDDFLLRGGKNASQVYESVIRGMSNILEEQVDMFIIHKGKHGVFDQSGEKSVVEASSMAIGRILTFFSLDN